MIKQIVLTLLIAGILVNTVPRYLNFDLPHETSAYLLHKKIYFVGQALSFVLVLIAAQMKPCKDKVLPIVIDFTIWLAVNNFIDELFFDPIHIGWNEIVFALLMLIYAIVKIRNVKRAYYR